MTDNHPAVTIVVPTLREAPNLEPLAERVAGVLAGCGLALAWELLLVDDDSDDDTLDVAGRLASQPPSNPASRSGMRSGGCDRSASITTTRSYRACAMPEQHGLRQVGPLSAAHLDAQRQPPWARRRRATGVLARVLNSRLATLLAAPLTACSDPMAGFFAVDRRALPDRATVGRPHARKRADLGFPEGWLAR